MGGQHGHAFHSLQKRDNPDFIIAYHPHQCTCCGRQFGKNEGVLVAKHQVFDIPKPRLEVTEHQAWSVTCCGIEQKSSFPAEANQEVQLKSLHSIDIIQWGVLKHLRKEIKANAAVIIIAIILDMMVLGAFLWVKGSSDILVIIVSLVLMVLIFVGERWFLRKKNRGCVNVVTHSQNCVTVLREKMVTFVVK